MKILRELFNVALIFTAIVLTFACTYFTSFFVNDGTWLTFLYFFVFMGMVFGIKQMGRYYVKNFM